MAKIYSVRDSAVGYTEVFIGANHNIAKRLFGQAVNNPQSPIYKFVDEHELYCVAEFDEDNGVVKAYNAPELIVRGLDVKKKLEEKE